MSIWTISGENGKSLPAQQVDVVHANLQNAQIKWRSQAPDIFGFLLLAPDPSLDPEHLPDFGQKLTVYRDGVRQITGKVTVAEFVWQGGQVGWNVQVAGGWSELDRIPLTPGNTSYTRAQGDLTQTIRDIVSVAIQGGAEIALGDIAVSFDMIPLTFRGLSCAAALAECLRLLPDAVCYFDYSGNGHPALTISRRPTMRSKIYDFRLDEIETCGISPQAGQTPDKVVVTYAIHDQNGVVAESTLTAGNGALNNQAVVLADSGFTAFQERAIAAQVEVQTGSSASADWTDLLNSDAALANYCTTNSVPSFDSGPGTYSDQNSPTSPTSFFSVTFAAPVYSPPSGVSITGFFPLRKGEWREWFSKIGIAKVEVTFKATFFLTGTGLSLPSWYDDLPVTQKFSHTGFAAGSAVGKWAIWLLVDARSVVINREIASPTILRDPGDYVSTAPPTSLAASLLEVQDFVPYRGRVAFSPAQPFARDLGSKLSFEGANPRLERVGAIPQEESVTLADNRRELSIGLPSRTALAGLMGRFRKPSAL